MLRATNNISYCTVPMNNKFLKLYLVVCGSHVQWSVTDDVFNIDVCSIENEKISMVCITILV